MKKQSIEIPPIIFLFVKPFGYFDNELWKDSIMRDTLKIHVVEKPYTKFNESTIFSMGIKLQELDYKRGFDYMICYHKESEEADAENIIVLHTTDEIFAKLKEEPSFEKLEVTQEI